MSEATSIFGENLAYLTIWLFAAVHTSNKKTKQKIMISNNLNHFPCSPSSAFLFFKLQWYFYVSFINVHVPYTIFNLYRIQISFMGNTRSNQVLGRRSSLSLHCSNLARATWMSTVTKGEAHCPTLQPHWRQIESIKWAGLDRHPQRFWSCQSGLVLQINLERRNWGSI